MGIESTGIADIAELGHQCFKPCDKRRSLGAAQSGAVVAQKPGRG
jgi:hypothetical protein